MRTLLLFLCGSVLLSAQPDDKRLVFSTLHGGDRNDDAQAVAVDADGFLYVTGETESRDLKADPVGGKPLTAAVFKAYLTKYSPGGKEVVWRKLIGGASNTVTHAIVLDRDGNVVIAGTTGARDLPLMKPIQSQQTGLNIAFVMKFNPAGDLLFSTYFGGNRNEEGLALAVDSQNDLYLAGRATSTDLPVRNALQPKMSGGGQDAFIAKITPDYQLAYATYLGGDGGTDNIRAIAVGPDDSLYVAGDTMSPGLATKGAYITTPVSYSGFLAKLTPAGDALSYFTYIGWRGGYSDVRALAVDRDGQAYLGGNTTVKDIPVTPGAMQPAYAGGFRDGFLLRVNADGSAINYLTYLGGSTRGATDPDDTVNAIAIDAHGHVYVAGETSSPDFPGRREVQHTYGGDADSFLMRLDLANNQLIYATFWGGRKKDAASAIVLGPGENATIAGVSYSDDFPIANATQTSLGSANDAFVAQICDPWLFSYPEVKLQWTLGAEASALQDLEVFSGCVQPFDATAIAAADQNWLEIAGSGKTVPMKLKLAIKTDGLTAPGEYKTSIRVTVLEAFYRTLEIPISITVTEPE